jgi:hypothetical protein
MPPATLSLVYFAGGPHKRQPRVASGPGGFTLARSFPLGDPIGGTFIAPPVQNTLPVGSETYNFSFMNVSGAYSNASGGTPIGLTYTDNLGAPPGAPTPYVQNVPIVALAVYVPPGGGGLGHGPSGATIDSFDETTGNLFDDTFVSVSPDPTGALTTSGNVEGYVDTTSSKETIRALSPTSPTGVEFEHWALLGAPATFTSGAGLTVNMGVSVSALAFYKAPPPLSPQAQACKEAVQDIQTRIRNKGPLYLPADFATEKSSLEKCVSEGLLTQTFVNNLLNEYANIALSR